MREGADTLNNDAKLQLQLDEIKQKLKKIDNSLNSDSEPTPTPTTLIPTSKFDLVTLRAN